MRASYWGLLAVLIWAVVVESVACSPDALVSVSSSIKELHSSRLSTNASLSLDVGLMFGSSSFVLPSTARISSRAAVEDSEVLNLSNTPPGTTLEYRPSTLSSGSLQMAKAREVVAGDDSLAPAESYLLTVEDGAIPIQVAGSPTSITVDLCSLQSVSGPIWLESQPNIDLGRDLLLIRSETDDFAPITVECEGLDLLKVQGCDLSETFHLGRLPDSFVGAVHIDGGDGDDAIEVVEEQTGYNGLILHNAHTSVHKAMVATCPINMAFGVLTLLADCTCTGGDGITISAQSLTVNPGVLLQTMAGDMILSANDIAGTGLRNLGTISVGSGFLSLTGTSPTFGISNQGLIGFSGSATMTGFGDIGGIEFAGDVNGFASTVSSDTFLVYGEALDSSGPKCGIYFNNCAFVTQNLVVDIEGLVPPFLSGGIDLVYGILLEDSQFDLTSMGTTLPFDMVATVDTGGNQVNQAGLFFDNSDFETSLMDVSFEGRWSELSAQASGIVVSVSTFDASTNTASYTFTAGMEGGDVVNGIDLKGTSFDLLSDPLSSVSFIYRTQSQATISTLGVVIDNCIFDVPLLNFDSIVQGTPTATGEAVQLLSTMFTGDQVSVSAVSDTTGTTMRLSSASFVLSSSFIASCTSNGEQGTTAISADASTISAASLDWVGNGPKTPLVDGFNVGVDLISVVLTLSSSSSITGNGGFKTAGGPVASNTGNHGVVIGSAGIDSATQLTITGAAFANGEDSDGVLISGPLSCNGIITAIGTTMGLSSNGLHITGDLDSVTGTVELYGTTDVSVFGDGLFADTTSNVVAIDGDVLLDGTGGGGHGLFLSGTQVASGSGDFRFVGRGGTTGVGVIVNGLLSGSSPTSLCTIDGSGGSTGSSNLGVVFIPINTVLDSLSLDITGQGGGDSSGTGNHGVTIDTNIETTGSVTITGTSGSTSQGSNSGVAVFGSISTFSSFSPVSPITITGNVNSGGGNAVEILNSLIGTDVTITAANTVAAVDANGVVVSSDIEASSRLTISGTTNGIGSACGVCFVNLSVVMNSVEVLVSGTGLQAQSGISIDVDLDLPGPFQSSFTGVGQSNGIFVNQRVTCSAILILDGDATNTSGDATGIEIRADIQSGDLLLDGVASAPGSLAQGVSVNAVVVAGQIIASGTASGFSFSTGVALNAALLSSNTVSVTGIVINSSGNASGTTGVVISAPQTITGSSFSVTGENNEFGTGGTNRGILVTGSIDVTGASSLTLNGTGSAGLSIGADGFGLEAAITMSSAGATTEIYGETRSDIASVGASISDNVECLNSAGCTVNIVGSAESATFGCDAVRFFGDISFGFSTLTVTGTGRSSLSGIVADGTLFTDGPFPVSFFGMTGMRFNADGHIASLGSNNVLHSVPAPETIAIGSSYTQEPRGPGSIIFDGSTEFFSTVSYPGLNNLLFTEDLALMLNASVIFSNAAVDLQGPIYLGSDNPSLIIDSDCTFSGTTVTIDGGSMEFNSQLVLFSDLDALLQFGTSLELSQVDGQFDLQIAGSGDAFFSGVVGFVDPINSLTISLAGTFTIGNSCDRIISNDGQIYASPITFAYSSAVSIEFEMTDDASPSPIFFVAGMDASENPGTVDATVSANSIQTSGTFSDNLSMTFTDRMSGGSYICDGLFDGSVELSGSLSTFASATFSSFLVTAQSSILSPGVSGTGCLNADSLDMIDQSVLVIDMNGGNPVLCLTHDAIEMSDSLSIGGDASLVVLATSPPTMGETYSIVLLEDGNIGGFFNGLPEGAVFDVAGVSVQISYADPPGSFNSAISLFANTAPEVNPDFYTVVAPSDFISAPGVLENDGDSDGGSIVAVLANNVPMGEGSVLLSADGSFTYTANGFVGATSFSYRAFDGIDFSPAATVTLNVIPATPSPTPTTTMSSSMTQTTSPTRTQSLTASITASTTQTQSSTGTPTKTVTPSSSSTVTPTNSPSSTQTPTITGTGTASVTSTVTPTPSMTMSVSGTATPSLTASQTSSTTESAASTPSPSSSATRTTSSTQTGTPSSAATETAGATTSPTASMSPTASTTTSQSSTMTTTASTTTSLSETRTSTVTARLTPSPTASATASVSGSVTTSSTRSTTASASSTGSPTTSASSSVSRSETASSSVSSSKTSSVSPTVTSTRSSSMMATTSVSSISTPSATPTAVETRSSSSTMSPTMSATRTVSSTGSPTLSAMATSSSEPTVSPTPAETMSSTASATVSTSSSAAPTGSRSPSVTATGTATSTATPTGTGSALATFSATKTVTASTTSIVVASAGVSATSTVSVSTMMAAAPAAVPSPDATRSASRTVTTSRTTVAEVIVDFGNLPNALLPSGDNGDSGGGGGGVDEEIDTPLTVTVLGDGVANEPVIVRNLAGQGVGRVDVPDDVAGNLVVASPTEPIPLVEEISSQVLNVTIIGDDGTEITSFDEAIELCFSTDGSLNEDDVCLGFLNDDGDWECEDFCLQSDNNGLELCGETDHLTNFALLLDSAAGSDDKCGSGESRDYKYIYISAAAVGVALFVVLVAVVVVEAKVRMKKAKVEKSLRSAGRASQATLTQ